MRGVRRVFGPVDKAAERALAAAVRRHGRRVVGAEILAAWDALASRVGPSAEAREFRWERVFQLGLAAGRVDRHRLPGRAAASWAPVAAGPLAEPPGPGGRRRVFGAVLIARCAPVEVALLRAVRALGRPVTTQELRAHLSSAALRRFPELQAPGLQNALEPAIAAGRVHREWVNRHWVVRPAAMVPAAPMQPWDVSMLAAVEEALRRAVTQWRSPVPSQIIAEFLEQSDGLARPPRETPLHSHLGSLVATRRAVVCRPEGRRASSPYYTPAGGPEAIRPALLEPMDRRWYVLLAVWRAARGRPVTTIALRQWALTHRPDWFADDKPYAWTGALQNLEHRGDVVGLRPQGRGLVRWAPSAYWDVLPEHERQVRLADVWRALPATPPDAGGSEDATATTAAAPARRSGRASPAAPVLRRAGAPVVDAAFRSLARNTAALVLAAQDRAAGSGARATDREILRHRPVTLANLREAAAANPHLMPAEVDLQRLLHESVRRRTAWGRVLVNVGVVGREAFFAAAPEVARVPRAARDYVAYRAACWHAAHHGGEREVRALQEAHALDAAGAAPVPAALLEARVAACAALLRARADRVVRAQATVPLLPREREAANALVCELRGQAGALECERTGTAPTQPARRAARRLLEAHAAGGCLPATLLLHPAEALRQVQDVMPHPPTSGGALAWHLKLETQAARVPDAERGRTRRVALHLDRVGFAAAAMSRWGGPGLRAIASVGEYALGLWRGAELVQRELDPERPVLELVSLVAALGLFDDEASRATIVAAYADLRRRATRRRQRMAVSLASALTFALAPKPVGPGVDRAGAGVLDVLDEIAADYAGHAAGPFATSAATAWRSEWARSRVWRL